MKRETLRELGKGSIALGNLIAGFSIINGLFGKASSLPTTETVFIIIYIFGFLYISGAILINKGSEDAK
jgi:hypothetical protein